MLALSGELTSPHYGPAGSKSVFNQASYLCPSEPQSAFATTDSVVPLQAS